MEIPREPEFVFSTPLPGLLMEAYIESGAYRRLKQLTAEKNLLNQYIQELLIHGELKRVEIGCDLVAKFIPKKVFEYDYPGLNEYLYDRGILQELTKLTNVAFKRNEQRLKLFEPYQENPEFYVKTSLNKLGRDLLKKGDSLIIPNSLEKAVLQKRENMSQLRTAQSKYNELKQLIERSPEFDRGSKIAHKYGAITRIQKPTHYHIKKIKDPAAIQVLIELGKPNIAKFTVYFLKGIITKKEVESFRTLKDIQLVFVILDKNEEAAMMNHFQQNLL